MLTPKRKTWFLVADGAKARLFESTGAKAGWRGLREWCNDAGRAPGRALEADRPTRGRAIGTGAPYAVVDASERDKARVNFLSTLGQVIHDAHQQHAFDQLVIAAPPAALGVIRKRLPPEVTATLIGAFDKDLTNLPEHALKEYFIAKLERW